MKQNDPNLLLEKKPDMFSIQPVEEIRMSTLIFDKDWMPLYRNHMQQITFDLINKRTAEVMHKEMHDGMQLANATNYRWTGD